MENLCLVFWLVLYPMCCSAEKLLCVIARKESGLEAYRENTFYIASATQTAIYIYVASILWV